MTSEILWIIVSVIILGIIVFLVSKNWKRTVQVMSGWGIYEAYNFLFDFIIWPILQALYGYIGVIILIIIALINNLIILLWYQHKKVDWFGVNVLEDIKAKGHIWVHEVDNHKNIFKKISLYIPARLLQFMIWLLNKNDIFAFVTLSVWQDSFITTIFLRHGKFDKLGKKDYIIFVSSTILSCIGWAVVMQLIIVAIRAIWPLF
jgi:hypothetical protein